MIARISEPEIRKYHNFLIFLDAIIPIIEDPLYI